ncbi:MAG TPA: AraC family transcriptional regulator [Bacteroidia bacterium]|nr:AraC family transcriptional regulator [Bacteroidia bacterium]
MAFEIKKDGNSLFREDFSSRDFEVKDFQTQSMDLELPFGTSKATQWFFDGIRMNYSESAFNEPTTLDWKGNTEMINMHFNLQGKISIIDNDMPHGFDLSDNQHNMFYGKEAEGKMKVDESQMRIFLVQFSKTKFLDIANDGNDAIKRFAESVANGKSVAFSDYNLNIDLSLQNCINSILNCNYSDSLKRMFFFSKAIEMLVLQAESFNKSIDKKTYLKKEYDKERIVFARDYLLKNIDCAPTLSELSKIAGINEFKLKKGFKETFHQTVFEYLSDVRLEIAKSDLLEKKKSITEIAFELGYSSLQHFSSAFKKKFGTAPSKIS